MAKTITEPIITTESVTILGKKFQLPELLVTTLETKSDVILKVHTRFIHSAIPGTSILTWVNPFFTTSKEDKALSKRLGAYAKEHKNNYDAMQYHEEVVNLILADPEF